MNTKRFLILTAIALFSTASLAPHSWAGPAARHRVEGAVIGIGAVILGQALLNHHRYQRPEAHTVVIQRYHPRRHPRPAGYWTTHKEWVPPKYEKVWNPGHYNRRGHWVPGHWTRIKTESGYWRTERVWVP